MNKKIICCILTFTLLLCLFAGCEGANSSGDTAPAEGPQYSDQDAAPEESAAPSRQPEVTPTPDPVPEITPPADEPADPASGTDVIYESETRPPDPASDTDLESD